VQSDALSQNSCTTGQEAWSSVCCEKLAVITMMSAVDTACDDMYAAVRLVNEGRMRP